MAARTKTLHSVALDRWAAAAKRLGLSPEAEALAAAMLDGEMQGAEPLDRRAALEGSTPAAAMRALAELEARGVVVPWSAEPSAFFATPIQIATAVREHVLGIAPRASIEGAAIDLPPRLAAFVEHIASSRDRDRVVVAIRGRRGSGRDAFLGALLYAIGESGCAPRADEALEPELSGRAATWDTRDIDPGPDERARAAAWLARSRSIAIVLAGAAQDVPHVDRRLIAVEVDPTSHDERAWIWSHALASAGLDGGPELVRALCRELRVGMGYAHRIAAALRDQTPSVAAARRALEPLVPPSSVRGVRMERPNVALDELVLDPDAHRGLQHVIALVRRDLDVPARGRAGVKALLSGPPGTGKTLAARALACELGRPLHRVDLASVVSKWLGETEKNLAQAFEAAEALGAVLLFDEAEALLGERGQVTRGSDRYANLEVAYLLQALEAHDGTVVVTTNARDKIDRAFLRRFDVLLELARPDPALRALLWRRELGEDGSSLDESFMVELAQRADLTGGHIAAASRLARVLAREAGRTSVIAADVLEALAFEHDKIGATVAASRLRSSGERWPS